MIIYHDRKILKRLWIKYFFSRLKKLILGNTVLSRCTSEATYHHEQLIDVTWGQSLMDEISYMRGTFSEQSEKYFEEVQKRWDEEEPKLAEEHPR